MCQGTRGRTPQKLIYVALQEAFKKRKKGCTKRGRSYIDELLGGPCPGPLAHFGPLSHGKYKENPTKTERLKIQTFSKMSPFWRPPKKEFLFLGLHERQQEED